ncbi:MAG: hypothetical protein GY858_10210, partial [Candidatus Omnitrophica bacterium]|nr:hypothetical protein [Candidatus Omnitrophota bacterium]
MTKKSSIQCIMDQVEWVLESYRNFRLNGNVKINFIHQLTKRKEVQILKFLKKKRCIITLRNKKDKLCMARCLAIGKRKADNNYPRQFHTSSTCTKDARELHHLCNIAKTECGLGEIHKFANH